MKGYDAMSRKKLEINKKHCKYNKTKLENAYKTCRDAKIKIKLLALLQFWDDKTSVEIANNLHKSDSTIREWLHSFNKHGFEGLKQRTKNVSRSWLSEEQLEEIKHVLQKSPRDYGLNYSNWSMPVLAIWIKNNFNITYKPQSLYDIVHKLGFTLQRPKKQSKNFDPELKEEFKKDVQKLVNTSDENTIILYEDEAIVTSEPSTTSKWALTGKQPVVSTNSKGPRSRKIIFGAVNPNDGKIHYSTEDKANADTFKSFLK